MDAAGIITGAIVAVVAGFVIPFITTQFSLWSSEKRELHRERRAAVVALIEAEARLQLSTAGRGIRARIAAARLLKQRREQSEHRPEDGHADQAQPKPRKE